LVEEEGFKLHYTAKIISLKRIFKKIKVLGEERNLAYKSYVIPMG